MRKIIPIIAISLFFVASIFVLFQRQKDRLLSNNDQRLCLNKELSKEELSNVLIKNAYLSTPKDAELVTDWLIDSLFKKGIGLSNLGGLNSRDFQIPVSLVEQRGGTGLKQRLMLSYKDLGCDSISISEYKNIKKNSAYFTQSDSCCTISVKVCEKGLFKNKGVQGVPIRLKEYKIGKDSINNRAFEEEEIVAFAQTNESGEATFFVNKKGYYSVLPIRKGYEYGIAKGTTHGKSIMEDNSDFSFFQKEHRIRIFDKATFSRIKADDAFCVRSVSDYITGLVKITVIYLLSWWCAFFFVKRQDRKFQGSRYQSSDSNIISLLMLLNAICIFMMLAITNPLVDKDYATEMIWGTLFGCIGLCLFSSIDYVKYYSGEYRCLKKPLKWLRNCSLVKKHGLASKIPNEINIRFDFASSFLKNSNWVQKHRHADKIPEGLGFLLIALAFVVLLCIFGTGPEGSTAKVNLWFFQPSEISKFFVVAAIALFFTAKASKIQAFANGHYYKAQFKALIWISLSVFVLLCLYILLISDMGPALVLAITFIIIYSIVRQDLGQMFFGVVSYIVLLSFADNLKHIDEVNVLPQNNLAIILWLSLIWCIVWLGVGFLWKKKLYESAFLMNLLILLFTHGGEILNTIGLSNQGQRLMNRISASGDGVWDNTVKGGDQVAQGIWALSSGGFWGQGLGKGNANLVPAYHTDMIFESIGEVIGFLALCVILVCYALLIRKSLIRAKEAGHPFLFYLIAGISIVTTVQLFVIIMGSLGIVPLTGVSLPFLSYGKAGLVINITAFGIIIGMSRNNPTQKQKESIIGYHNVIKSGISIFTLFFVVIITYAFKYQVLFRDMYLTKPAYITNLAGEHFPEQNPRINLLLRNLYSGNIYDRNGVLLATSNPDTLLLYKSGLMNAGIDEKKIDSLSHCSKRRYYPFGEHLFFMLGDMNTRNLSHGVLSKNPYGYLAEERHIDSLRGLSIPTQIVNITRVKSISSFLPDTTYEDDWAVPIYGENKDIVRMLKDGVNGSLVKKWNEKRPSRDIKLTIDAKLQMALQNALSNNAKTLKDKYSRISLVVLNAKSGDLLCSANYPLPNQEQIVSLFDKGIYSYRPDSLYGRYTERDLGLTFQSQPGSTAKIFSAAAGLAKDGIGATKPIYIFKEERIHKNRNPEPAGKYVDMKEAIVKSSNCFFVNLVHKNRLYSYLAPFYMYTGICVDSYVPYMFSQLEMSDSVYLQTIKNISLRAYEKYDDYISKREKKGLYKPMNFPDCAMAWGQGKMLASPLNMARMVSIVANDGMYSQTRYLLGEQGKTINCLQKNYSELLKKYMVAESEGHPSTISYAHVLGMGGKTGTPTRTLSSPRKIFDKYKYDSKRKKRIRIKTNKIDKNDGWYVCFFNSTEGQLALALRIEQCTGSSIATKWINEVIMPCLKEVGYINY